MSMHAIVSSELHDFNMLAKMVQAVRGMIRNVSVLFEQAFLESLSNHTLAKHHMIFSEIQKRFLQQNLSAVFLPSIEELCRSFHCTEIDVVRVLNGLLQQGYSYEFHGLKDPILLRDPLQPA